MANKELTIALNMDRSKAQASVNEEMAGLKRLQDLYSQSYRSQERSARETAKVERDEAYKTRAEIEKHEREKRKVVEETGKKRVEVADKAEKAERKSFETGIALAGQFRSVLGSFSVQMLGFNSIEGAISAVGAEFTLMSKSAVDAAKEVTRAREAILELAALKGRLGQTSAELGAGLGLRRQTLQTADEARAFELAARGAGGSAIGKQISEAEFNKLMGQAGAFQVASGINPETAGTLAGSIPLLMGRNNVTANDAFGSMRQLEKIFSPGAATYSQLSDQLLKGQGLTTSGIYRNMMDQASLLSFFSLSSKEGAGELVNQFTRATIGGLGKARAPQLLGGMGDEEVLKQGEYLASLGANAGMDPLQIGRRIAADMRRAQAQAQATGTPFNQLSYLREKGYTNEEDMRALMIFAGGQGTFEQSFAPLAGAAGRMQGDPMADIRGFQASDPTAMQRRASLAEDAARISEATTGGDAATNVRRAAFARLKQQGRLGGYGTFEESQGSAMGSYMVDLEATNILAAQGEKVGIPISDMTARTGGLFHSSRTAQFGEAAQEIQRRGGQYLPEDLSKLIELTQKQLEATQRVEKALADSAAGGGRPPLRPPPKPEAGAAR